MYPDGFGGDAWRKQHRGAKTKRRLKRHRDAALDDADDNLGADLLDRLLAQGAYAEVRDRVVGVVDRTDLVTTSHSKSLRDAQPSEELARALRDFIHGDATEGARFDRLRSALGRAGANGSSWPLLTGLRALTHPGEHVCVRPSVLKPQAKVMGHKRRLGTKPTPKSYARCLAVAEAVRDALTQRGHAPRDFLDVYDFVWVTMRPAARKELVQRRDRSGAPAAQTGDQTARESEAQSEAATPEAA
jgi:hypothetical protein